MAFATTKTSLKEPDWFVFLRAACAVAEGASVSKVGSTTKKRHTRRAAAAAGVCTLASACVSAVLGDPLRRITVFGGREGLPRSLGSVYGGSVTRFLGGFRGVVSRTIATPGVETSGGLAITRDGTTLLVTDTWCGSHALHLYSMHTGAFLRRIGGYGDGPLQFNEPYQVWIAPDGFVFVADFGNGRIQILTPQLTFRSFVGEGQLSQVTGVCANNDVIVASDFDCHCLTFFNRRDGALLRRVGSYGRGDAQLRSPYGLCFMSGYRHVAVAECDNSRISVWTLEGEFVRHIGARKLQRPHSIACSDANELVVADWSKSRCRVKLFSASGALMQCLGGNFNSVAMRGSTMYAQDDNNENCVIFS